MRCLSVLLCIAVACSLAVGCRDGREAAPATGAYGPAPSNTVSAVERARPDLSGWQPWTKGVLSVIQTELSPAVLYHARSTNLTFFAGMPETGLGAPSYVALPSPYGPKIFKSGTPIDPAKLNESWLVVWFAGAQGWTNWDSPWLVTLQHRPTKIELGSNGLSFTFSTEAGYAAAMPLYGYYKPAHSNLLALPVFHGKEKKKRVLTFEWEKALPADPLARARYWDSALKEFPIYCEDSFSVDRSRDAVVLRQQFRFLSWNDDWNTKHIKLAPISPVLAHAFEQDFPAEFSKKPFNMEIFTPYGPVFGIEGVDSYDVTLPVLRYVNETEAHVPPNTKSHPTVAQALQILQQTTAATFDGKGSNTGGKDELTDLCAAVQARQWYAKALPYLDDQTRTNGVSRLREYLRELLVTNRFALREFPQGSGRTHYILQETNGVRPKAGPCNGELLETLWVYAHITGDKELIRERWPLIRALFLASTETRWVGFGHDAATGAAGEAASALSMARLAYMAGDMESYNYACQVFARELVHAWVKQRGAGYFREHQPWHSMEPMDGEVYLAELRDDPSGWHIDGPKYPAKASERLYEERWTGFSSVDVGRFYRDHLLAHVRRELNQLGSRESLVQLRSLLLNETPAQLASNAVPEKFTGPASGVIANCISVLRTSQPVKYERLIPGGPASPFVVGIERDVPGPNVLFVQGHVVGDQQQVHWPRAVWPAWQTPSGKPWNFGQVVPGTNLPVRALVTPLNWNSKTISLYR